MGQLTVVLIIFMEVVKLVGSDSSNNMERRLEILSIYNLLHFKNKNYFIELPGELDSNAFTGKPTH